MAELALQSYRTASFVMITRFWDGASEHPPVMPDDEHPIADHIDDAHKGASADRMAAAAAGATEDDDGDDRSPGDAAEVPVPSEDAAAGSSETFPPVTS
jgi:hypothetical protein